MPIYEYRCGACGHAFEEWQKMSDPPVRTCPKCKKKKVEKLISHTSFSLKGGGWYKDLYTSAKPKDGGSKDGGGKSGDGASASAKGGGDDGGGSDSKSESKSDSKE